MVDDLMEEWTMSARVLWWITGRILRKSSDRRVGNPPKLRSHCRISWMVRSSASRTVRWRTVVPSVALGSINMRAKAVPLFMLHICRVSEWELFSGTLNFEWTDFPPVSSVVAIPRAAVAMAISPRNHIFDRIVATRKVLPVPPGALKPWTPPRLFLLLFECCLIILRLVCLVSDAVAKLILIIMGFKSWTCVPLGCR